VAWRAGDRRVSRAATLGAWVALVVAAAVLGAMTRERNRDYWSNETILAQTAQKSPENAGARIFYGVELLVQGGPNVRAIAELQQHLALFQAGRPLRSR